MATEHDPSDACPSPLAGDVYRKSLDCVHCGLCLSACPTYRATGRETSSPRGRIYLMRGVAEGRIPLEGLLAEEAFLCVGCRACETACPSGVEYGSMLEQTREAIEQAGLRTGVGTTLERFALRQIVAKPWRLWALMGLMGFAQRVGLDRLALRFLPDRLRDAHAFLPEIPSLRERRPLPEFTQAQGERRGSVAFLSGCVMHEMFPDINHATVRVLARNGFDVHVPRDQGCCGALHAHSGDLDFARDLARKNVAAFGALEVDAVVNNSAGCGTALRELGAWIPGEGDALAALSCDVTVFLARVGMRPPSAPKVARVLRVCYDDPCHLVHSQGVSVEPRTLLRALPGIELIDYSEPARCCGAAGIYNLTQPEMSHEILDVKMDTLADADPDVIASGNPGCLLQLRRGVSERGMRAEVVHPIELIDRAYRAEEKG